MNLSRSLSLLFFFRACEIFVSFLLSPVFFFFNKINWKNSNKFVFFNTKKKHDDNNNNNNDITKKKQRERAWVK